ncbi:MAG: 50S ribosomal protein L39e [Saccharolobus sp.]|uniref:50S ribosomal protein L39e n=1 Tax=Saccharolobus TaxID=2100760 RepID=UPI001E5D0BB8|nr:MULTISPECIES: 50S ribosomal protein L39e [Saccharolobus]MDT7861405.1 50S ribosomal protein L39e [Saccharolobus sp.]
MSRNKPLGKKLRLSKAMKSNVPIPIWVVLKTGGRVRFNPLRRSWRRNKLKV